MVKTTGDGMLRGSPAWRMPCAALLRFSVAGSNAIQGVPPAERIEFASVSMAATS
jgi:hypothetical protein